MGKANRLQIHPQSTSSFKEHAQNWSTCDLCPISKLSDKRILYSGPFPSTVVKVRVLFIGEAPGMSEYILGEPFVGPSGELLRTLIKETEKEVAQLYYDRRSYTLSHYLVNLIACTPFLDSTQSNIGEPSTEEIKNCSPRVQDFIDLVKPRAIACLGKLARKHINTNIPQIYLPHPASILRSTESSAKLMMAKFVTDLSHLLVSHGI